MSFYDYIKKSAQKFSNEEVCGLVLKNFSEEIFVQPCINIHKDKRGSFRRHFCQNELKKNKIK